MISRRELIRNLVITVGGSSLLSACGGRVTLDTVAPGTAPRFYSDREMALLSRVSDLLLPRTETPGAVDVNVPGLLDQLMSEWANTQTRGAHRTALRTLDRRLGEEVGGDILDASEDVAREAYATVDAAAYGENSLEGYRGLKSLITQAYFATEAGAEEQGWDPAPGRWDACVERS